jgi:hypothetical protein
LGGPIFVSISLELGFSIFTLVAFLPEKGGLTCLPLSGFQVPLCFFSVLSYTSTSPCCESHSPMPPSGNFQPCRCPFPLFNFSAFGKPGKSLGAGI